jgi:large subunit ribosomal protein L24
MKITTNSYLKVGDTIKIITGANKGFIGKIKTLLLKKSILFIEGILPRIKYVKTTQNSEPTKKEIPIAIHISNVMLFDAATNKEGKIGYKLIDGKKSRYFKKSGKII